MIENKVVVQNLNSPTVYGPPNSSGPLLETFQDLPTARETAHI